MSLTLAAIMTAAGEEHHIVNELPMAPVAFGLTALGILMFGLVITLCFRSVGTRHD